MQQRRNNQPKPNVLTDALMASCILGDYRRLFDTATNPKTIINLLSGTFNTSLAAFVRDVENDRAAGVRLSGRRP